MTDDAKLNYIGPIPKAIGFSTPVKPWWKRLPVGFLCVVVAPTLIAMIYFLLIASPRYTSEARFIVRAPSQSQPSSLGVVLQGVGLSTSTADANAVHEYIHSRDGLKDLGKHLDVAAILGPKGADIFSRYPHIGQARNDETLFKAFKKFVVVGYDSTSGISTLRVEAFKAKDAQAMSLGLLEGGERLVNRLNERSAADQISEAVVARDLARAKLALAQQQLTAFRNREQFLSPELAASQGNQLVNTLLTTLANLQAERAQLIAEAPNSPQLPVLDSRIRAYNSQVEAERAKMAGSSESLAPKISAYEDLVMAREFADKELAQATASLITSEQEARRKKLYLERVVSPNLPDTPSEPRRWIAILTVFASAMLAYGVGWLIWAGVHEHRQA